MADFKLEDLEAALKAEGVELDRDALARAWRKVTNPGGCEHCGQHVKVGVYITKTGKPAKDDSDHDALEHRFVTACCKTEI